MKILSRVRLFFYLFVSLKILSLSVQAKMSECADCNIASTSASAGCSRGLECSNPVLTHIVAYTVNLVWVNRALNPNDTSLFPLASESVFIENILKWASFNPQEATVVMWYDGVLTPPEALENTKNLIDQRLQEATGLHSPIAFKDLRQIPLVAQNQAVFSSELPVYFRADLLRIIAAYHALSTGESDCFVYADFDMPPLSKEAVLDSETLEKLEQFGIVMEFDWLGFENGFQILTAHRPELLDAIKCILIDLNIARGYLALEQGYYVGPHNRILNEPMKALSQIVYDSYQSMFAYYYFLRGWVGLYFPITQEPYDKDRHGMGTLGLDCVSYYPTLRVCILYPVLYPNEYGISQTLRGLSCPTKKILNPHRSNKSYD